MNCGCIYTEPAWIAEDYEEITFIDSLKERECSECYRTILVNEEHTFATYTDNDYIKCNRRICVDCQSIIDEFFCNGTIFGKVWEQLAQHVYDVNGEISSECITSLTPRARNRLFEMIEDVWDEINYDEEDYD